MHSIVTHMCVYYSALIHAPNYTLTHSTFQPSSYGCILSPTHLDAHLSNNHILKSYLTPTIIPEIGASR